MRAFNQWLVVLDSPELNALIVQPAHSLKNFQTYAEGAEIPRRRLVRRGSTVRRELRRRAPKRNEGNPAASSAHGQAVRVYGGEGG